MKLQTTVMDLSIYLLPKKLENKATQEFLLQYEINDGNFWEFKFQEDRQGKNKLIPI
jgi:hypothetical protein